MREVALSPLTPLRYLERSGQVWRDRTAVRFHERSTSYGELLTRVQRLAGALQAAGVEPSDRVATLLPNVPAMLELHFAVPWAGGALVPMNTRLAVDECRYILEHSGARCLVAHESRRADVERMTAGLDVTVVLDDYEDLVAGGEPLGAFAVEEERALLSLNYTSGTTGRPKGVMYVHRGAYLHALGVIAEAGLGPGSSYLWTLPMFHCNGWAYTWAVTAMGGCHVCLEAIDPAECWRALREEGVTHLCGAPTVLTMLVEAPEAGPLERPVQVFVGGAPPSPALLERAEGLGMRVTHLYGLTETYGPIAVCAWDPGWDDLPVQERARLKARQGVGTVVSERMRVVDADMRDVPADGETLGEVVMRGNNVMVGYYRDPEATEAAFAGGWFHSGDLGVMHPDGYVELRDRAKDIVISGGENISTIEVEQALAAHADVVEAAVVGVPDERWGETVKAFVTVRAGTRPSPEELQDWVRGRLARFKAPRIIEFVDDLPRTATGKIQKFLLRERG